ncbi:hypothetical protein D1007_26914 [Hordeum vulgare]|nr:hypothetical protein D1007_26914 [Hordeum vulgare]
MSAPNRMVISTRTNTFGNPSTGPSSQQRGTGGSAQAGDHPKQQQGDIPPPRPPPKSMTVAQFLQALRQERQANNAAIQQLAQVLVNNQPQGSEDSEKNFIEDSVEMDSGTSPERTTSDPGSYHVKEEAQFCMEKNISEILLNQKSLERIVETKFHDLDVKVIEMSASVEHLKREVDDARSPNSTSDDKASPPRTTTQFNTKPWSAVVPVMEARPSSSP